VTLPTYVINGQLVCKVIIISECLQSLQAFTSEVVLENLQR